MPLLVGGYSFEFRLYYVERNRELEGVLLQELERWHRDFVIAGKPPAAEAGDTDSLRKLYPEHTDGYMDPTPEVERWARAKVNAFNRKKNAETEEDLAKNRLRQLLGDHEAVKASWGGVTNRCSKATVKTDWRAIVRELGVSDDLLKQFSEEVPGRRSLRVTVRDQGEEVADSKSAKILDTLKARDTGRQPRPPWEAK